MVGFSAKYANLTHYDYMIAGGASGCITRGLCQPLDVIKIRFQLQVEPISRRSLSKYRSIFQAIGLIHREEGIRAFWKGHVPAQLLSIVYGMGQFWSFELLTAKAHKLGLYDNYKPVVNFGCGAAAGCFATIVSFPFDVVRTRLIAQSERHMIYRGLSNSFYQMYTREGFFVLFRGLWPTLLQVAPHAGFQFMSYKIFDSTIRWLTNSETISLSSVVVSGSLAGFCAKIAVYPFDLAKKRMQIQGFEEGRKYFGKTFACKGLIDCTKKIYKVEGLVGLYKGLGPSLLKAVVTSGIHFSSYELICKILAERYK